METYLVPNTSIDRVRPTWLCDVTDTFQRSIGDLLLIETNDARPYLKTLATMLPTPSAAAEELVLRGLVVHYATHTVAWRFMTACALERVG